MRKKDLESEIERLRQENERLKNTSKIPELEEWLKNMTVKFWCEKSKNIDRIKSINKTIEDLKCDNVVLAKQLHDLPKKIKEQNQKAIEQLEKVKESLKHFCEIHSDEYYSVKSQVMGIYQDVCEFMDQQINELKGNA